MSEHFECEKFHEVLSFLVDCEECEDAGALVSEAAGLDREEQLLLLAHATGCAHCADALEAERHLRAFLRSCFEDKMVPEEFESRLLSRLEADVASRA